MRYPKFPKGEIIRPRQLARLPPDPRRWKLQKLAETRDGEELALTEWGVAEWIDVLAREDELNG